MSRYLTQQDRRFCLGNVHLLVIGLAVLVLAAFACTNNTAGFTGVSCPGGATGQGAGGGFTVGSGVAGGLGVGGTNVLGASGGGGGGLVLGIAGTNVVGASGGGLPGFGGALGVGGSFGVTTVPLGQSSNAATFDPNNPCGVVVNTTGSAPGSTVPADPGVEAPGAGAGAPTPNPGAGAPQL